MMRKMQEVMQLNVSWTDHLALIFNERQSIRKGKHRKCSDSVPILNIVSLYFKLNNTFSSVRPLSCARIFVTWWTPCPSPTQGVYSDSSPLNRWCYPTISFSVIPFSFCPKSFPASGSFPMSQLFASGGQSIGVSASTSVLPMSIQDWFPLGLIGWISLQCKGSLKSLLQHHRSKASILWHSAFFIQLSHLYMMGKTIA